jgi:hypothetical protein
VGFSSSLHVHSPFGQSEDAKVLDMTLNTAQIAFPPTTAVVASIVSPLDFEGTEQVTL